MSAAGVVQQKQRLRNHGVVQEAACKSVEAPMAKFFDEMLAHVRSLTGMRIPFLSVSTAFAGMIFAPAVLLLQLTVEDVTGTYDRIVDLVGNRTPSNWRRLDISFLSGTAMTSPRCGDVIRCQTPSRNGCHASCSACSAFHAAVAASARKGSSPSCRRSGNVTWKSWFRCLKPVPSDLPLCSTSRVFQQFLMR